jgi:hypothetical protein
MTYPQALAHRATPLSVIGREGLLSLPALAPPGTGKLAGRNITTGLRPPPTTHGHRPRPRGPFEPGSPASDEQGADVILDLTLLEHIF